MPALSCSYLQPEGDWQDGLDLPFCYIRREQYVRVAIGGTAGLAVPLDSVQIAVRAAGIMVSCNQTWAFREHSPFVETITFVLPVKTAEAMLEVLLVPVGASCQGTRTVAKAQTTVDMELWRSGHSRMELELRDNAGMPILTSRAFPHACLCACMYEL